MEIIKFNLRDHYMVVKGWWEDLGGDWVTVPPDLLPSDGFIAYYENKPIAAMFLYLSSNSKMAFLAWPISDKNSNPHIRGLALKELNNTIKDFAESKGYFGIFASAPSLHIKTLYEKFGYIKTEETTAMVLDLKGR